MECTWGRPVVSTRSPAEEAWKAREFLWSSTLLVSSNLHLNYSRLNITPRMFANFCRDCMILTVILYFCTWPSSELCEKDQKSKVPWRWSQKELIPVNPSPASSMFCKSLGVCEQLCPVAQREGLFQSLPRLLIPPDLLVLSQELTSEDFPLQRNVEVPWAPSCLSSKAARSRWWRPSKAWLWEEDWRWHWAVTTASPTRR